MEKYLHNKRLMADSLRVNSDWGKITKVNRQGLPDSGWMKVLNKAFDIYASRCLITTWTRTIAELLVEELHEVLALEVSVIALPVHKRRMAT